MRKVVLSMVMSLSFAFAAIAVAADTKVAPGMAQPGSEPTCGQKVASMAHVPAKLSEEATAVAEILEAHAALMGKDKDSQAEVKGLRSLVKTEKQLAASLLKASEEMKKAASWPAAPHDMGKMASDPKLMAASQKLMSIHKELAAIYQKMAADAEAQAKVAKK